MNRRSFIAAIAAAVPAITYSPHRQQSSAGDGIALTSISHPQIDYRGHSFDAAEHQFCTVCGESLERFVDLREPCPYQRATYATARRFDTEGELYQSITGQPGPARS